MTMTFLDGKVVIITGAGRGLGLGAAYAMAAAAVPPTGGSA
jgi:NAD(P)-dependent dehydrogenase (short-subunit alcohol dehydrogenase family)